MTSEPPPPPAAWGSTAPKARVSRKGLLIVVVLIGVLAILGQRGNAAGQAARAPEASVTLSGTGDKNTAPFTLAGGNYTVSWSATASSHVGCYHSASLKPEAGGRGQDIGSGMFDDAETHRDTTHAYGVDGGRYYVSAISGCSWTITISPA